MIAIFSFMLMFIAFSTAIDRIMLDIDKKSISAFVSKGVGANFSDFESSVISSAISLFLKEERLSNRIIFLYSIIASYFVLTSTALYLSYMEGLLDVFRVVEVLLIGILVAVPSAYLSFPSDVFSFYITKKIFWRKKNTTLELIPLWFVDVFISSLIPIFPLVFIGFFSVAGKHFDAVGWEINGRFKIEHVFILAAFFSTFISILISIFQASSILFGLLVRVTIGPLIFTSNKLISHVKLEEHPFTTISVIVTLYILVVYILVDVCERLYQLFI
jgi:hypothetical protein